jgi:hypothetical protein
MPETVLLKHPAHHEQQNYSYSGLLTTHLLASEVCLKSFAYILLPWS